MKPSDKYQEILRQSGFSNDPSQARALHHLDDLQEHLLNQDQQVQGKWWHSFLGKNNLSSPVKGIYFWGGVGRGKTFLMDIFYQCVPFEEKQRSHFHQFMNQVHESLKQAEQTESPLEKVASGLSARIRLLCLDEFVISDIGDAMIMAGLLEALIAQGVVLVTTSNSAPTNLYRDGLQRARFLPAIELLEQHCEVVNLDGDQDYRLKGLQQTDLYHQPHSAGVQQAIESYLASRVTSVQTEANQLIVNGRSLEFQICAEDTVWFSFDQLCRTNRSQNDYLELAKLFNTLILTDIELMNAGSDDVARRFVLLIDVLYDHRVKLICSAAGSPEQLYQGERLAFEFQRTVSRLIEMQSRQYLASAHTQQ